MSKIHSQRYATDNYDSSLDQGCFGIPQRDLDAQHGDFYVVITPVRAKVFKITGKTIMAPWLQKDYYFYQVTPFVEFNLNSPEPVPNGSMRNAWTKGLAAFAAKSDIADYPGDKGTAPHTVWTKGYLWSWIQHRTK